MIGSNVAIQPPSYWWFSNCHLLNSLQKCNSWLFPARYLNLYCLVWWQTLYFTRLVNDQVNDSTLFAVAWWTATVKRQHMVNKHRGSVWKINSASHPKQKARLMATNTTINEFATDNKYLVVDNFVTYFKEYEKRRILPWQRANLWSTTPVGLLGVTFNQNKIQQTLPVCRQFSMELTNILTTEDISMPAS